MNIPVEILLAVSAMGTAAAFINVGQEVERYNFFKAILWSAIGLISITGVGIFSIEMYKAAVG